MRKIINRLYREKQYKFVFFFNSAKNIETGPILPAYSTSICSNVQFNERFYAFQLELEYFFSSDFKTV